jgi:hypothetical protein
VALLLLRLPSASDSAFFLQQLQQFPALQLQHRTFLSQPHFSAAPEGCRPDLEPSSTETLDPPTIAAFEPTSIPTLEPAIDLLAKHLQQFSFLKQMENLLYEGHIRDGRPPLLDWVVVGADSTALEEVTATSSLQS